MIRSLTPTTYYPKHDKNNRKIKEDKNRFATYHEIITRNNPGIRTYIRDEKDNPLVCIY